MNCTHPKFVSGLVQRCREALPASKSAVALDARGSGLLQVLHSNKVYCSIKPIKAPLKDYEGLRAYRGLSLFHVFSLPLAC